MKVTPFADNSPESQYSKLLTAYATEYVLKQLKMADKTGKIIEENDYCGDIWGTQGYVTFKLCMYLLRFHDAIMSPHVCSEKKAREATPFSWAMFQAVDSRIIFSADSAQPTVPVVRSSKEHRQKLSQHQKFPKASIITSQLASVASEVSTMHFEWRIKLLNNLLASWRDGTEVTLVDLDSCKYHVQVCVHVCVRVHVACILSAQ